MANDLLHRICSQVKGLGPKGLHSRLTLHPSYRQPVASPPPWIPPAVAPRRPLIITSMTLPFFKKELPSTGGHTPSPALPSTTPVETSRIMLPDDTNVAGNVHGGTILKMIEQAGHIVSNRHCNRHRGQEDLPITTALVRLEKMDFHQPMFVGEIAQLQAAVTYASPHSLEAMVDVWGENVLTGARRHTNTASLWYVGIKSDRYSISSGQPLKDGVVAVPPLEGLAEEEEEAGRRRYKAQKKARRLAGSLTSNPPVHVYYSPEELEEHTVMASQTTLANLVLPSDCAVTGHMLGGALMKMMDNAAAICAARHCRRDVVTVCIDVINFHRAIRNGGLVFVTARLIFASDKSMEIEVTTEAEAFGPGGRHVTNTAYFAFVSLGEDGRPVSVPPLKTRGDGEEATRLEEGRRRYLRRKEARLAKRKEAAGTEGSGFVSGR